VALIRRDAWAGYGFPPLEGLRRGCAQGRM